MLFSALQCCRIRMCFFFSHLVKYFIVFYFLPLRSIGSFVHIIEFMDYLLDDEDRQVLFKTLLWLLSNHFKGFINYTLMHLLSQETNM